MRVRLGEVVGSDLFGLFPSHLYLDDSLMNLHTHILGSSGSGKTKLLIHLFLEHLNVGSAVSFIDPSGGAAEEILGHLLQRGFFNRPDALDRFIYVELSDREYFLPFNILKLTGVTEYERVKLVIEATKRVFPELSLTSAMYDAMMTASLHVLVANDLSLFALNELLTNKDYAEQLLTKVSDPHVRSFFERTWHKVPPSQQLREGGSALRRSLLLMGSPAMALTLGQKENVLDLRQLLDRGTSLLINLGPVVDTETQLALGALLLHGFEVAAMSRPSNNALPRHHLIVDEFTLFASKSPQAFLMILDRARQKGLFLTVAHQSWTQTDERLAGSVQGVAVKIGFNSGYDDSHRQAKGLGHLNPEAIKKEATSETGQPIFLSLPEQEALWAKLIRELPPGIALAKLGSKPPQWVKIPRLADPHVDTSGIKQRYFDRFYVKREKVILPFDPGWAGARPILGRGHK